MGTLLGHLAVFGSFSYQGEVLCTAGLAYLLQDHDARRVFADQLGERTRVKVSHQLTWQAEAYQAVDRGRPDLEGRVGLVPLVKIEAKLGAELNGKQFRSYVTDLHGRWAESILLVLVPGARIKVATDVVVGEFGLSGPGPWRPADYPDVAIAVVSWDDVLTALGRVESQRFRSELEQFDAMYRILSDDFIPPLAGREDLENWRKDPTRFIKLVDQTTRYLTKALGVHNVSPMAIEPLEQEPEGLEPMGYNRRYVCRKLEGTATPSCFSIGVRDPFEKDDPAGPAPSPIWLRFNRTTGGFSEIRTRLQSSGWASKSSGGHVWVPLNVPFDVDGNQMVKVLVEQAESILQVAYPAMR